MNEEAKRSTMGDSDSSISTATGGSVIDESRMKHILSTATSCKNRDETVNVLREVVNGSICARLSNVFGDGPILVSDIPNKCSKEDRKDSDGGVFLGIDEAGRGPVLGPMTYAAAYWHPSQADSIPSTFNDSKQLSSMTRNKLFDEIQSNQNIGFVLRVLHASEISRNMLRAKPYNLNAMSHDSAIQMIRALLDSGVKINTCFVDTVGIAESYKLKLEREFVGHGIKFVVEKKADATYAPCSAASVVAKVSRDCILESWKWSEPDFESNNGKEFGSGYPSDPKCKEWLEKNLVDPVFGYPDLVRFSWGPAKAAMKEDGVVKVEWKAEEEDDESCKNQMKMNAFLKAATESGSNGWKKRKRCDVMEGLKLKTVGKIIAT